MARAAVTEFRYQEPLRSAPVSPSHLGHVDGLTPDVRPSNFRPAIKGKLMPIRTKFTAIAIASSALLTAPSAIAQQFINVLTGGTSGVYYPPGVAIAKIYRAKIRN